MSVAERLHFVRRALRPGVELIAVSKTIPVSSIREAYAAGQRHFGESYAQELRDKALELRDLSDIRWHFIGGFQSNKARFVTPTCIRVHSVAQVMHAKALAARGHTVGLLAVNIGREPSKQGVDPELAITTAKEIVQVPGFELRGLMCVPPAEEPAEPYFRELSDLAEHGRRQGIPLTELSMGMTGDYETAIACGATWIRVGTAIFGERSSTR